MNLITKFIDKISKKYSQYKNLIKIINKKTTTKTIIKSVFFSVLLIVLIYFIPAALIINLFIYNKLHLFLSIILLLLFSSLGFVYFKIYYKLLLNYNDSLEDVNLKLVSNVEGIFLAVIIIFLGTIILSVVF